MFRLELVGYSEVDKLPSKDKDQNKKREKKKQHEKGKILNIHILNDLL